MTHIFAYIWPSQDYFVMNGASNAYIAMSENELDDCESLDNTRICKVWSQSILPQTHRNRFTRKYYKNLTGEFYLKTHLLHNGRNFDEIIHKSHSLGQYHSEAHKVQSMQSSSISVIAMIIVLRIVWRCRGLVPGLLVPTRKPPYFAERTHRNKKRITQ